MTILVTGAPVISAPTPWLNCLNVGQQVVVLDNLSNSSPNHSNGSSGSPASRSPSWKGTFWTEPACSGCLPSTG
jgi:hypothetical protein